MVKKEFNTDLIVNERVIELNNFVQNYIGAVVYGIVYALGAEPGEVELVISKTKNLEIKVNDRNIEIRKPFVYHIVESTVRGLLSPLKDVFFLDELTIKTKKIDS